MYNYQSYQTYAYPSSPPHSPPQQPPPPPPQPLYPNPQLSPSAAPLPPPSPVSSFYISSPNNVVHSTAYPSTESSPHIAQQQPPPQSPAQPPWQYTYSYQSPFQWQPQNPFEQQGGQQQQQYQQQQYSPPTQINQFGPPAPAPHSPLLQPTSPHPDPSKRPPLLQQQQQQQHCAQYHQGLQLQSVDPLSPSSLPYADEKAHILALTEPYMPVFFNNQVQHTPFPQPYIPSTSPRPPSVQPPSPNPAAQQWPSPNPATYNTGMPSHMVSGSGSWHQQGPVSNPISSSGQAPLEPHKGAGAGSASQPSLPSPLLQQQSPSLAGSTMYAQPSLSPPESPLPPRTSSFAAAEALGSMESSPPRLPTGPPPQVPPKPASVGTLSPSHTGMSNTQPSPAAGTQMAQSASAGVPPRGSQTSPGPSNPAHSNSIRRTSSPLSASNSVRRPLPAIPNVPGAPGVAGMPGRVASLSSTRPVAAMSQRPQQSPPVSSAQTQKPQQSNIQTAAGAGPPPMVPDQRPQSLPKPPPRTGASPPMTLSPRNSITVSGPHVDADPLSIYPSPPRVTMPLPAPTGSAQPASPASPPGPMTSIGSQMQQMSIGVSSGMNAGGAGNASGAGPSATANATAGPSTKAGPSGSRIKPSGSKQRLVLHNPDEDSDEDPDDDDHICALPTLRLEGAPDPVIWVCPGRTPTVSRMTWYRLRGYPDPNILMCTRCYAERVEPYAALKNEFVAQERDTGFCSFASPRVKDMLRKARAPGGSIKEMLAFFDAISELNPCAGEAGAAGPAVTWYRVTKYQIHDFYVCEMCYEDTVKATPWKDKFETEPVPLRKHEVRVCDLSHRFFRREFLHASMSPGGGSGTPPREAWYKYAGAAGKRKALPTCSGAAVPADSTTWWTSRRPMPGFVVCDACHYDYVYSTSFESQFVQIPEDQHPGGTTQICKFHPDQMRAAYQTTLAHATDSQEFWAAAQRIMASVGRKARGEPDTFYTLSPLGRSRGAVNQQPVQGELNWDVCEACFVGYFATIGAGAYMAPSVPNPERVCDMCPGTSRHGIYTTALRRTLNTGLWPVFSAIVQSLADILPCPRDATLPPNVGRWYGFSWLTVCPECWATFGSKTALAEIVELRDTPVAAPCICGLYSPRMRQLWTDACTRRDVGPLRAESTRRLSVYGETVYVVRERERIGSLSGGEAALWGKWAEVE